jgi:thiol-disulfide isomerase/thioredoxin
MNTRRFAIFWVGQLVLLSVACAQGNYGVSDFTPGFPSFLPAQHPQWLVSHQEFAAISMNDSLGPVCICRGLDRDGTYRFVLIIRQAKGFSLSWLDLNAQADGSFRSTLDIRPYSERSTFFPLDVHVVAGKLNFRWMLSRENTPPGGIPVPAEVAIDNGKSFPNLQLVTLDGGKIASSSFRGKVIVINSWSTWCTPCVQEIPGFNKLVVKYGDRVRFIAVAQNKPEDLKKFLQQKHFSFTHAIANDEFNRLFGVAYPRTTILNKSGIIVFDKTGGSADSYKEVDSHLEQLSAHE